MKICFQIVRRLGVECSNRRTLSASSRKFHRRSRSRWSVLDTYSAAESSIWQTRQTTRAEFIPSIESAATGASFPPFFTGCISTWVLLDSWFSSLSLFLFDSFFLLLLLHYFLFYLFLSFFFYFNFKNGILSFRFFLALEPVSPISSSALAIRRFSFSSTRSYYTTTILNFFYTSIGYPTRPTTTTTTTTIYYYSLFIYRSFSSLSYITLLLAILYIHSYPTIGCPHPLFLYICLSIYLSLSLAL